MRVNKNPGSDPVYAVVATVRALMLIELKSKQVTPLDWDKPEYYGISWRPEGNDLILSHSMLDNNALRDVSSYATSEVGILSEGPFTSAPFLSQPHQIALASDHRIICTNTGRNSILVFDPVKPNLMQEVRVSDARWDRLSPDEVPGDHLNSVFEKNGVLYAIAHRHGKGSALAIFSYPDLELISLQSVKNRSGLHNIWVTDEGQRISCHSETGAVIELNTDTILWDSGSPVYTRGLAASADFVLVGESERTRRASRRHSMSGLWLLDRQTWKALDYFCLGSYGAVHEVRLLNLHDDAHHGHTFAGLDALLKRDRRNDMTAQRLNAANRSRQSREKWKSFELIFGSPVLDEIGGQIANAENLCLIVQREHEQLKRELAFSYSLENQESDSHLAIVAYRGNGGDSDMNALVIQRISDTEAEMCSWIHDRQTWTRYAENTVNRIPLRGDLRFSFDAQGAKLWINGEQLTGKCLDDFQTDSGTLGVRWLGATIWPANG